jgi:hypothetical protein
MLRGNSYFTGSRSQLNRIQRHQVRRHALERAVSGTAGLRDR